MKLRKFLYSALALLAAGMMAQSCVSDTYDCPDTAGTGKVQLKLTLDLGDMGRLSRADGVWNPDGPSEGGKTFDNTLKLNDYSSESGYKFLHVILIDKDDNLLHLDLSNGFQLNPVSGGYEMVTTLDLSDPDKKAQWKPGQYRVLVLANFRERPSESGDCHISKYTTLSELQTAIDAVTMDWFSNDNSDRNVNNVPNIPMWGMSTINLKLQDDQTETFSVQLLRAVAKIRFQLSERLQIGGYKIVKCEVLHCNKKIHATPAAVWSTYSKTSDSTEPYYDSSFHANKSYKKNIFINAPGYANENDGDGTLVFYLPEREKDKDISSGVERPNAMNITVANDLGEEESCYVEIDNSPLGAGYYKNDLNSVNRNHLYQFTLDKEIEEGELTYKVECWNLAESAIGWNPDFQLVSGAKKSSSSSDSEADNGFVMFPSYSSSSSEVIAKNDCSFADYKFTLKSPAGAVWKAFLVEVDENGVEHEYTSEDKFATSPDGQVIYSTGGDGAVGGSAANTPSGFFFGVGNEDGENYIASTTGVARSTPYIIKIGTRMRTTDFSGTIPLTVKDETYSQREATYTDSKNKTTKMKYFGYEGDNIASTDEEHYMVLNSNGTYWKNKEKVPTCYLVIKIALDGVNFTERLRINPQTVTTKVEESTKNGVTTIKTTTSYSRKFYGDDYRVEVRQLFPFFVNKYWKPASSYVIFGNEDPELLKGTKSSISNYKTMTWWGTPMGYPLSSSTTSTETIEPEPEPEPEPDPTPDPEPTE